MKNRVAVFAVLWACAISAALVSGHDRALLAAQDQGKPSAPAGQQPASGQPATQNPPDRPPDAAQPRPSDGQTQSGQPTFRAGINFVRVDAIVSDSKGNPIIDLKAEDFAVSEDGKPQTVESFKLVKVDAQQGTNPPRQILTSYDEESEAQRDDVRLFAIFLDDYHVRRGASMFARAPISKFIQTQLSPADMLGLMYPLTPVGDVKLTRNHDAIAKAVEKFDGRKFDYVPRNEFEERYANYPAEVVERVRNQVSLSALRSLVVHLGSLREGRKAVILVSEGYSNYLPPQLRDPVASMPGYGNPSRSDPFAGEGEDRARFFSSTEMLSDLRQVYDVANRNNVAIYALDPRGLAPFEYDINEGVGGVNTDRAGLRMTQDTLKILADETDGRAIVDNNDLSKGLRQIVRDSSSYYLLGYNSSQAPQDGKFHEIKVRVNRRGVQVRHRKGYWALTPEETARALEPPKPEMPHDFQNALASAAARPPSQAGPVRTWVGTTRGDNGRTRVTFVWEPVPPPPGARSELAARVQVTAIAPDGSLYFRGRVPDSPVASAAPSAAPGGPGPSGPSQVTFDAPPGELQIRYSVEDANNSVIDSDSRQYTVPDLTGPQVQLSTPEVLRARTVAEFRQMNTDPHAVPTPGREFRRTDRLLIRFDAYAPSGAPAIAARLLNRTGQAMLDLPVANEPAGGGHQIDLPLAGMAAAEYVVEITAKTEAGEAKQLVGLRVVS